MEAVNGQWLKLYRKTLDNPIIMKDGDHLAIWTWLLLKATWCESDCMFDGKRIKLMPGQLPPISRRTIASELQISESKVQRVLKLFENEHQIEQQMGAKCRLISILNWDSYQFSEPQSEQRVNTKRTTSEPQVNTIKEYKNNKKDKNNIYSDVPEGIKDAFMDWAAMRKKQKKPLETKRAVSMALKKLDALARTDEQKCELIDYAIYRGWLSFYPIPADEKLPKPKKEEPPPKPIDAVPMPEETRERMNKLGLGNLIGEGENYGT